MAEMTQLTPGPVAVGTKSRDVVVMGSETTVMNVEITELEPNRLRAPRIDAALLADDIRYELSGQNGKTRLAYTAVTSYNHWFAKCWSPSSRRLHKKAAGRHRKAQGAGAISVIILISFIKNFHYMRHPLPSPMKLRPGS